MDFGLGLDNIVDGDDMNVDPLIQGAVNPGEYSSNKHVDQFPSTMSEEEPMSQNTDDDPGPTSYTASTEGPSGYTDGDDSDDDDDDDDSGTASTSTGPSGYNDDDSDNTDGSSNKDDSKVNL